MGKKRAVQDAKVATASVETDMAAQDRTASAPGQGSRRRHLFGSLGLTALTVGPASAGTAERATLPGALDLWRVPDALQRVLQLPDRNSGGQLLERFLPTISPDSPTRSLQLRAAIASTFVAALELARNGDLVVVQHQAFEPIALYARHPEHSEVLGQPLALS